jgi:plastocyanin
MHNRRAHHSIMDVRQDRRPTYACRRVVVALITVLAFLACNGDTVAPFHVAPPDESSSLYWHLKLSAHAVTLSTLAPFDTLQLTATPVDADGHPLSGLGTARFSSSEESSAHVSADGLLTSVKSTTGKIAVIALLSSGTVTHGDTVWVTVTADTVPPTFASLSIHPVSPDSAKWAVQGMGGTSLFQRWKRLSIHPLDAQGQPIAGISIAMAASDSSMVGFLQLGALGTFLNATKPGHVTLYATATAYGVTHADTLPFTITMPLVGDVTISASQTTAGSTAVLSFAPSEITISPGGTARWYNVSGQPVDVTFDDTANVAERGDIVSCGDGDPGGVGNIPAFGDASGDVTRQENCRSRLFPVEGTYGYHTTSGATGKVIVSEGVSSP